MNDGRQLDSETEVNERVKRAALLSMGSSRLVRRTK